MMLIKLKQAKVNKELVIRKVDSDAFDNAFGAWADEFDPKLDSVDIVNQLRTGCERTI